MKNITFKKECMEVQNNFYEIKYAKHGFHEKAIGDPKRYNHLRHDILISNYDISSKKIIDVGCGFGDMNISLRKKAGDDYSYLGVDLFEKFVMEAKKKYGNRKIKFECCNFLECIFDETFDYGIVSGIFNMKLSNDCNYEFAYETMKKMFSICNDGFSCNFLSDKVDYKNEENFYFNPAKILEIAYSFSRRIILRNDYMPFEFSIFVFKDGSFSKDDAIFTKYKEKVVFEKHQNK